MQGFELASAALVSSIVSFAAIVAVRAYAVRAGVIDRPNARSSHEVPTPRGGGLAILAGASISVAFLATLGVVHRRDAVILGAGAWSLAALGWVDDHSSLRASTRLAIQVAVALLTVASVGGLPHLQFGALTLHLGRMGIGVAVIGLVWSTNLFNFMDGIDALAASQASLIFGAIGALLLSRGDSSLGTIAIVLGSASLGFLPWNWPRARIFLGDVGSAPIGYLIGAIGIVSENRRDVPLLITVMISGVFIVDATITLLRRLMRGERLSQAHRNHAYQRLSRAFNSHGIVSFGAALETALFAALSAIAVLIPSFLIPAVVVVATVLAVTLLYAERRAPMRPDSRSAAPVSKEISSSDGQAVVHR